MAPDHLPEELPRVQGDRPRATRARLRAHKVIDMNTRRSFLRTLFTGVAVAAAAPLAMAGLLAPPTLCNVIPAVPAGTWIPVEEWLARFDPVAPGLAAHWEDLIKDMRSRHRLVAEMCNLDRTDRTAIFDDFSTLTLSGDTITKWTPPADD